MRSDPTLADDVASMSRDIGDAVDVITRETDVIEHAVRVHAASPTYGAVRRVAQNVAYIERLASLLLDRTDADSGTTLRLQRVRLAPLVADVTDRTLCTRDRHRVSCHAASNVTVSVDVLAIERVIASFVRNALLRTLPESPIWVRVDGTSSVASVSIIDRAGGIPERSCAQLFVPTTAHHEDRAHSLYDSRLLLEAHQGRAGVENVPGKGTRLFFELPACADDSSELLAMAHVARRPVADLLPAPLVDDSCCRTWPLADGLRARGAKISVAYDQSQLQCALEAPFPDVVIIEAEAATSLRRTAVDAANASGIAMVAIAWLPVESAEVSSLIAEKASYLQRPIDLDRLLAHIAKLLGT